MDSFFAKFALLFSSLKTTKRALYFRNFNKWWNVFKYELKVMLIKFGKENSTSERRDMGMMKHTLDQFHQAMSVFPENKQMVKQYFEYKKKIMIKQLGIAKEKMFKEEVNKFLVGDSPTKEFFDRFKRKSDPGSKLIYKIKDENGEIKSTTAEILETVHKFYKKLYSDKNLPQNNDLEDLFFGRNKRSS